MTKVRLMMDSGAFSAWSRREELDLKLYIDFVKRNQHLLGSYVNLDVIPGVFGQKRSPAQVEESASRSYDNLNVMRKAGLAPITVFHQDEEWKWLDRMLDDGNMHIGLSSGKDAQISLKIAWLDKCFSRFCDKKGNPLVKTHGFGITNPVLLHRYPWYTVDSTTWTMTPAFGQILVPAYHDGQFDYYQPPLRMIISGVVQKSNQRKQFVGFPLEGEHQTVVNKFLEGCGLTISDVRNDGDAKRKALLYYHRQLLEHLGKVRFRAHHPNIRQRVTHKPIKYDRVDIAYATQVRNHNWSRTLNETGDMSRLVSYYEFLGRPDKEVEDYVNNGTLSSVYNPRSYKGKNLVRNWASVSYKNFRRYAAIERERDGERRAAEHPEDYSPGAM